MIEPLKEKAQRVATSCILLFLSCLVAASPAPAAYFDTDMKTDIAIWRPGDGIWYILPSSEGYNINQYRSYRLGDPADRPVPGDYDGDGKTDIAVWRPGGGGPGTGVWYLLQSSDGYSINQYKSYRLGDQSTDLPVPGDYDGDGKTDLAVWRPGGGGPGTGVWYLLQSSDGYSIDQYKSYVLGDQSTDIPVPGDYDGDGRTDLAVWRPGGGGPGTGAWYILQSSDGYDINLCRSYVLGDQSTDIPVPGDYDGDGKTDIAIWRPSSGTWFLLQSSDGYNINLFKSYVLGDQPTDQPVPGDYDGDGKTDLAVWRPSTGYWYILQSSDGYNINQIKSYNWGNVAFNDVTVTTMVGSPSSNRLFDIATTSFREMAFGSAFDGTNYLVGIQSVGMVGGDNVSTVGAQFVSATGAKVGSFISTGRSGGTPSVAFDNSNYLLTWADDASLGTTGVDRLYGMFVQKNGTPGAPFQINDDVYQDGAVVAFGGGKYFAAYNRVVDGSGHRGVFGRLIDPAGTVGAEIPVSADFGRERSIAYDGSRFLVVWVDDGDDSTVWGRFVTPSGTLSSEFVVNGSVAHSDNPLAVIYAGGKYLVAWNNETGGWGSGEWDIFGQFVDTSGTLLGSPFTIVASAGGQHFPSLSHDGGNYLVTWTEGFGTANMQVKGRFFDSGGNPVGPEFTPAPLVPRADGRFYWGSFTTIFANGKFFSVVNVANPGDSPGSPDDFTNADVVGAFFRAP